MKAKEQRGDKDFFISKDDFVSIEKNFIEFEILNFSDVQKYDNVFFFDSLGNVQYQAYVSNMVNNKIYIICETFNTGEKYETELKVENIKELDKRINYEIKIYRTK